MSKSYRLALSKPNLAAMDCQFGPVFSSLESAMQARAFLECSGKAKYPVMVVNTQSESV